MHCCTIDHHARRHPTTRRQRRACQEQSRLDAGFIALHLRPAPAAPNHRQERAVTRGSLAAYRRRSMIAA